jgi:MoaA/NifB/PqqE/SkfB family radical SAM enzyme
MLTLMTEEMLATPPEVVNDCQLNVYNIRTMQQRAPAHYRDLRFDPNNMCNLQCVYCHNARSDDLVDPDQFREFINNRVLSVFRFQVGCIMEPTLDKRLTDFLLTIAASPARPTHAFALQTNGILIHRHDHEKIKQAGLTDLCVSLDTADPTTQKNLRDNMSLDKVVRNLRQFSHNCPNATLEFVSVVTRANIDSLEGLVELGLDLGVKRFIFRELSYFRDNTIVDHERMPSLVLLPGQFAAMMDRINERFDGKTHLIFAPNDFLDAARREVVKNSALGSHSS